MSKCISRERKKSRRVAAETEEAVLRGRCGGAAGTAPPPRGALAPPPHSDLSKEPGRQVPLRFLEGAPKPATRRGMKSGGCGRRLRHSQALPPAGQGGPQHGGRQARPGGRRLKRCGLWLWPQNHLQAHPSPCGPVGSCRKGAVSSTPQSPRSPHWGAAALNNALGRRCPAQRQLCVEQVQRPPRFLSSKAPATGRKGPHLRLHPLGAVSP